VYRADEIRTPHSRQSVAGGRETGVSAFLWPEIGQSSGLKVAQRERMRFRPQDPAPGKPSNDDPFAEFPAEPSVSVDAPKNHDWLSEFPDEKTVTKVVRSKTWGRLSEGVKDENR
jgi:hypothetical protein